MRILVLGGTGFIGSHIVDGLLKEGHFVKVLGRKNKYIENNDSGLLEYVQADFSDSLVILEALIGIDAVIHLISSTVPSTSNSDPIADIQSNLVNSVNLFKAMRQSGVKRIMYFSSGGTVYGNPKKLPISESHPTHPISSYGIIKLAIENYLFMYQELYGLDPIIFRLSNPYGPRQGHLGSQGVIGTFMNQILQGQPIKIWGDGSVIRDYIYIADVVSACLMGLKLEQGGIFNIGSGCGESLLSIINTIQECTKSETEIIFEPSRGFDVKEVVLDISLAKEKLSWEPKYSLESGVGLHCEWLKSLSSGTHSSN